MKRALLFLFCALMSTQMFSESSSPYADYYWYWDSVIYLEKGDREFIIYNDSLLSALDKEKFTHTSDVSYPEYTNLKWGTTKPNAIIEDEEHVLYRAPSYKVGQHDCAFVSHRFLVKLKNSEDRTILQNMADQYNVTIIEEDYILPLWNLLQCGLPSTYNAMELANIFYESGLFAVTEPSFLYAHSDDETAITPIIHNQPKSTKKILRNGILMIEKDGRTYNIMGVEITK